MSDSTRTNRSTLTYVLIGAAAAGLLFLLLKEQGPAMRRYVRVRRM